MNRLVRGRNFPPFFAFGDPALYFEPPIEWERQPIPPPPQPVAPGTVYVPSLSGREKNQAAYVGGKSALTIGGGAAHPSGDGCMLLPRRAGTVEFFFKPDWSTFDLGEGAVSQSLVKINVNKGAWSLVYRIDPEGTNVNMGPRDPSHSLYGAMMLDNGQLLRLWRTQMLFERDEWVHLAFVWGPEVSYGPRREKLNLMVMRIYVNGKGSKQTIFRTAVDALAAGTPGSLTLGSLQGVVEDLRISDVQRYTANFTPSRERELAIDEHTRALFTFNGSMQGQGHGGTVFEAKVK